MDDTQKIEIESMMVHIVTAIAVGNSSHPLKRKDSSPHDNRQVKHQKSDSRYKSKSAGYPDHMMRIVSKLAKNNPKRDQ
jgi:hypothetical protein